MPGCQLTGAPPTVAREEGKVPEFVRGGRPACGPDGAPEGLPQRPLPREDVCPPTEARRGGDRSQAGVTATDHTHSPLRPMPLLRLAAYGKGSKEGAGGRLVWRRDNAQPGYGGEAKTAIERKTGIDGFLDRSWILVARPCLQLATGRRVLRPSCSTLRFLFLRYELELERREASDADVDSVQGASQLLALGAGGGVVVGGGGDEELGADELGAGDVPGGQLDLTDERCRWARS